MIWFDTDGDDEKLFVVDKADEQIFTFIMPKRLRGTGAVKLTPLTD
jgi:hypothetical protein